jgi:lipoate-protein ligase A
MVETLCKHFLVDNLWDSMLGFLYNNGGEVMIQELNQQLKSMYLEPRNKLRVDVDYVIGRLDDIMNSVFLHSDYLKLDTDIEEFIKELKENMENHNGN